MTTKRIRNRIAAIGAAAVLSATMAAPAMAWTHTSMGGKVTVSGRTIWLRDNAADGRFVTTEYRHNNGLTTSGLANKNGYGTTVSATQKTNITNAKICRSNPGPVPVDCGRWRF